MESKRRSGSGGGRPQISADQKALRERLDLYIDKKGLRSTEQRRLIIDTVFEAPSHLTIDDVLELVHKTDSRIGYATVYRTMKMLSDAGVVEEYQFGDGFTRYELAHHASHHDHIICLDCGAIQEFEEPLIEELQDRVAQKFGFRLDQHKHELYGYCLTTNCPRKSTAGSKSVKSPSQ